MNKKHFLNLFITLLMLITVYACAQKSSFAPGTYISEDGRWSLTLSDDGTFRFLSAREDVSGTYSIQGNELTWETDPYCEALGAGKATYTWTLKNDTLLMTVKGEDPCHDRMVVSDNIPYLKQP